jgi:hypothetical protein
MNQATKRSILRWTHLFFTIPIIGYIYSPFADIPQYATPTRYVFLPILILTGYWMYAGLVVAILGLAAWLGAYQLAGYGPAILSQVALLIGRKIWLMIRARRKQT